MKLTAHGVVLAEVDDAQVIQIEGNAYIPLAAVTGGRLEKSDRPYRCPWKGEAQYYHLHVGSEVLRDAAWGYPVPLVSAVDRVGRDFSEHVAFDRAQITVEP